jgi:hypothetical protein
LKIRSNNIDPETKLACAFEHLAEGRALSLLLRYESQLNRTYDRAFKHLQELQASRTSARAAVQPDLPNEPKPFLLPPPNEPELDPAPESGAPEVIPDTPQPLQPTPKDEDFSA